jgi:hypothetical protein
MDEREVRLGDLIDDYCPRCRHLLNHAVASMVGTQVAKVICQTCYTEHAYRHGEAGKRKSNPRATLFDQVLATVSPGEEAEGESKTAEKTRTAPRQRTKLPRKNSNRRDP